MIFATTDYNKGMQVAAAAGYLMLVFRMLAEYRPDEFDEAWSFLAEEPGCSPLIRVTKGMQA